MKNEETEANKADMRLKDLQLTSELLAEAVAQENGARERIAEKHRIQKSVITDRVRRIEQFFGVNLFEGPQRKTPTTAGKWMAKYGLEIVTEIEQFAERLREVSERDEVH